MRALGDQALLPLLVGFTGISCQYTKLWDPGIKMKEWYE